MPGEHEYVYSLSVNLSRIVLSCGSDNLVNLWRVASASSAPWLGDGLVDLDDDDDEEPERNETTGEDPPDVRVSIDCSRG